MNVAACLGSLLSHQATVQRFTGMCIIALKRI